MIRDNNIFTTINDTSAYMLGMIWADGNIYYPKDNRKTIVDITNTDKQIMQEMHTILTPNKKLYSYQPKKGKKYYSIKTRDPDITHSLESLGLIPNKSLKAIWPKIKFDQYLWSFIRGVFDGDGCVFNNKVSGHSYLHISITGKKNPFIEQLFQTFETHSLTPRWYEDPRNTSWQIKIYKKKSIKKFATNIYKQETICMHRKKQIFLDNKYLNYA